MLEAVEVVAYLENLPRDVCVLVSGVEYFANRELLMAFSPVLKDFLSRSEDPVLSLDIDDSSHLFGSVIDFLYGSPINITPSNAYSLKNLADFLQIQPLINNLQPYINAETDLENVIPRLLAKQTESDFHFLTEHIEELASKPEIYELPKEILLSTIHSQQSRFSNDDSRYLFAFRCAAHTPGVAEELFTREYTQTIPSSILARIVQDQEFACLESKIPSIFDLSRRTMDEITSIRIETSHLRLQLESEIEALGLEDEECRLLSQAVSKQEELFSRIRGTITTLKQQIDLLLTEEMATHGLFSRMGGHSVSESLKADIHQSVESVCKAHEETMKLIQKMQGARVVYPLVLAQARQHADVSGKQLEFLKETANKVRPNAHEISEIVEHMNTLYQSLNSLSTFLNTYA